MAVKKNEITNKHTGRVGFATGTGRCGTQFITKVFAMEPTVSSSHERNIHNESFHRYCKWYDLPVDEMGFIYTKQIEIEEDLKTHLFSFEASAQLSFSIKTLYDTFNAKFIFLVRSPEKVVNSFKYKNIYSNPYIINCPSQALGYQKVDHIHHFLGRFAPIGDFFNQWNRMTQIGRIAWYWKITNQKIFEQLEAIPGSQWRLVKLENFDYEEFLKITNFLGIESKLHQNKFDKLRNKPPNAFKKVSSIKDWTSLEIQEFESQVAPMADKLGYKYRINDLII